MSIHTVARLCIVAVCGLVIYACGNGDGLDSDNSAADGVRRFSITITAGRPKGGPTVWKVRQGDRVSLTVTSDDEHEVHLHEPYDIEREVEAGGSATLDFVAKTSGSFEFEIEDTMTLLGNLEVR